MDGIVLLLHLLGATIWTGGHLVLAVVILPRVLRERSPQILLDFESGFEKIGMPALIIQVFTGVWLAYRMLPDLAQWFNTDNPLACMIITKLFLLALTMALAINARLRVIPILSVNNLGLMAGHIIVVTVISVAFVFVGVSFRTGWLY